MSNYVVERRQMMNPVSASDWEEWSEWCALESFDTPKDALDFIRHGHVLVGTRGGYSYENRIVTSDGRIFAVKGGVAELAGLFDESEPFVVQFRMLDASGSTKWKNLLELDAPKPKTLEEAWKIIETEKVHDTSSEYSYQYRILDAAGEVVGSDDKPLAKKEKVEVEKERWLEVCAIELRLTTELAEVEKKILSLSQFGPLDFRDAVAKYKLRRDDIKRFLGRD